MLTVDAVDYIGVNAYYPLTKKTNPTVDELKDAWITKSYVGTLERLARTFNTQLILTEVGYRSIDGAVGAPWDFETAGAVNVQEQANAYQTALETFWEAVVGRALLVELGNRSGCRRSKRPWVHTAA